ncbi:MAG: VIT and VWA domain-containing protein, partial [Deltaproteobacteria bacterium]|nr:VIT and VWA domain-containing protein [Deltaproteobacteria bacterium]
MPVLKKILAFSFALSIIWALSTLQFDRAPSASASAAKAAKDYKCQALDLEVEIEDRQATVILRFFVENLSSSPLSLDWLFPLPYKGAVSNFQFKVNGKEVSGQYYPRDEAFSFYRNAVTNSLDNSLMRFAGFGLFKGRASDLRPGIVSTLELKLVYQMPQVNDLTDFNFPLESPMTQGGKIGRQSACFEFKSDKAVSIFSPLKGVEVKSWVKESRAELKAENSEPIAFFRLFFQRPVGPVGGLVMSHRPEESENGFFLFQADPLRPVIKPKQEAKTVLVVLERFGANWEEGFKPIRSALAEIVESLASGDSFNIVYFNEEIKLLKPQNIVVTNQNKPYIINLLKDLPNGLEGDLNELIPAALKLVEPNIPAYALLLTYGQGPLGPVDEFNLADRVNKLNAQGQARIFAFGLGQGFNARLLDRLSSRNGGFSSFVDNEIDLKKALSAFFSRLTMPFLYQPELSISLNTSSFLPPKLPDLFRGDRISVVGRYPHSGPAVFTLSGYKGLDK